MPPKVRLFWAPWSHYCVCAELQLAHKGVNAELVTVPYHDKTRLIAETGQDYVPALDWGGRIVPWKEIPTFLEDQVPEPSLFPFDMTGVATILERWGHQVLEEKVWSTVVTKVAPTFRDERERWVFEEIQRRVRGPLERFETLHDEFLEELEPELAWIDTALDGRDWLLGEPSLADWGVYGGLSPIRLVGENVPDHFEHLPGWIGRVEEIRRRANAARSGAPASAPAKPGKSTSGRGRKG